MGCGEEVGDYETDELEEEGGEDVENEDEDAACWKVVDDDLSRF